MKTFLFRRMVFINRILYLIILFNLWITNPPAFAQWQPCQGFYGGSILALGGNSNLLLASSPGGLYKSNDEGLNWQFTSFGIEGMEVRKLAIGGNTLIVSTSFDGVFISYDLGDSWQMFPNSSEYDELGCAFVVNGRIFISFKWNNSSMPDPLYKSDDGGLTWQSVSAGLNANVNDFTIMGNDIYIGTENGIYVSVDSGITWQPRKNGLPANSWGNTGWTDYIINMGNTLIALSDAEPGIPTPFLMVSVDSGLSWQAYDTIGFGTSSFLQDIVSVGNKLIASNNHGLLLSLDTGRTWMPYNNGILQQPNANISPIFEKNGKLFIGGYTVSLFYSADTGLTWSPRYEGIMGINPGAIGYYGNNLFISPQNTNTAYISTDEGNTWDTINPIFNNRITAFETKGSTIIAGANFPNILISNDGGNTWNWDGPWGIGIGGSRFYDILIDTPNIFLLNSMGTYRSPDNGVTWINITPEFSEVATAITNIGNRYVLVTEGDGAYYSDDDGFLWNHTVSGIPNSSTSFYPYTAMYGIEEKDGLLFAGTYDEGVLMSADSGSTWVISSNGLPIENTGYIYCMTHDSVNIYVGSLLNGVYFSPDNAQNWYPCNLGLPSKMVYKLVKSTNYLLASTLSNGLWKLDTQTIGVNIPSPVTENSSIQIFPNPITAASVIKLKGNHPNAGFSVYDMLGKELISRTISDNQFQIGNENFKSGVYLVKIITNGKQFTKKMIIQ